MSRILEGAAESLTGIAGAEDLQVMADLPEAILLGNRIGPTLHSRS